MASDWNEYKIDDLKAPVKGSIAMGPFGSRIKAENFVTEGVPIIKGGQLHGAYISDSGFDFLTPEKAEELKSSQAYRGDLVITHRGTIGQVSIIPHDSLYEKYIVSQSQLKVSFDKTKVNPYFVNYFFRSHLGQHRLLANASQVGVPAIAKASTSVKAIMVPCPSLEEQNKVVGYLKNLDDKIELNRQMNETLEAMAQALFKSWFVDFDPVIDNALAAGNAIPDEMLERAEQRKGIEKKDNSDIQKLFTDAFEFTKEMGWIPKGWSIKKAEETASITIGKTPPRKESKWFSDTQKDNLVWVSIRDMGNSNVFINDSSEYLTKESIKKFNVKVIPKNSVMLSFKLTLGRVLIAQKELTTNEAIAHFCNPQFSMSKEYIYCYLSNFKYDSLGSTSSIATAVNSKIIKGMPFIVPSEQVLSAFETLSKIYFDKISLVNQQIDSLANLRDTLLPKLMSGELRIPDAAALVEEI